jgi:hypothetical protein
MKSYRMHEGRNAREFIRRTRIKNTGTTIHVKSLGRSLGSFMETVRAIGATRTGFAAFDGDGDGFVTGPNGEDKYPSPLRIASQQFSGNWRTETPTSENTIQKRALAAVQYARSMQAAGTPFDTPEAIAKAFAGLGIPESERRVGGEDAISTLTTQPEDMKRVDFIIKQIDKLLPDYREQMREFKEELNRARAQYVTDNPNVPVQEMARRLGISPATVQGIRRAIGRPTNRATIGQSVPGADRGTTFGGQEMTARQKRALIEKINRLRTSGIDRPLIAGDIGVSIPTLDLMMREMDDRGVLAPEPTQSQLISGYWLRGFGIQDISERLDMDQSEVMSAIASLGLPGLNSEMPLLGKPGGRSLGGGDVATGAMLAWAGNKYGMWAPMKIERLFTGSFKDIYRNLLVRNTPTPYGRLVTPSVDMQLLSGASRAIAARAFSTEYSDADVKQALALIADTQQPVMYAEYLLGFSAEEQAVMLMGQATSRGSVADPVSLFSTDARRGTWEYFEDEEAKRAASPGYVPAYRATPPVDDMGDRLDVDEELEKRGQIYPFMRFDERRNVTTNVMRHQWGIAVPAQTKDVGIFIDESFEEDAVDVEGEENFISAVAPELFAAYGRIGVSAHSETSMDAPGGGSRLVPSLTRESPDTPWSSSFLSSAGTSEQPDLYPSATGFARRYFGGSYSSLALSHPSLKGSLFGINHSRRPTSRASSFLPGEEVARFEVIGDFLQSIDEELGKAEYGLTVGDIVNASDAEDGQRYRRAVEAATRAVFNRAALSAAERKEILVHAAGIAGGVLSDPGLSGAAKQRIWDAINESGYELVVSTDAVGDLGYHSPLKGRLGTETRAPQNGLMTHSLILKPKSIRDPAQALATQSGSVLRITPARTQDSITNLSVRHGPRRDATDIRPNEFTYYSDLSDVPIARPMRPLMFRLTRDDMDRPSAFDKTELAQEILNSWNGSSNSRLSLALAQIVAQAFNTGGSFTKADLAKDLGKFGDPTSSSYRLLTDISEATYDLTQEMLAALGLTHVAAFRGYEAKEGSELLRAASRNKSVGPFVGVPDARPISSWTMTPQLAESFVQTDGTAVEDQSPTNPDWEPPHIENAMIIGSRIPSDRIFATFATGAGVPTEFEIIPFAPDQDSPVSGMLLNSASMGSMVSFRTWTIQVAEGGVIDGVDVISYGGSADTTGDYRVLNWRKIVKTMLQSLGVSEIEYSHFINNPWNYRDINLRG